MLFRSEIFDVTASFDNGEGQIAEDGNNGVDKTDHYQNTVINGDLSVNQLEDHTDQQRNQRSGDDSRDSAFNRFIRADIGTQLMLAKIASRKIRG